MAIFNPKTAARHVPAAPSIPPDHATALADWAALIASGRIETLSEVQLHGDFKARIVEGVLGYTSASTQGTWTVQSEQGIGRGAVDLALGHFSDTETRILAPFELKGARTRDLDAIMPGRNKSPVQQAWEYAIGAQGVQWVLVSNYVELRLYAFGEGSQEYERFELRRLTEPAEYARFMLFLSAETLLSGRTRDLLDESRREDKDVTDRLYADYKDLRATLIGAVREHGEGVDALDAIATAQTILDRVLFIAFAEDTGLLPRGILSRAYEHSDPFNPRPVWGNFQGLFRAIDKGNAALDIPRYNGGLFREDEVIDALALPDAICAGFERLGSYDFGSEIGVTILGRIFEQSITDIERLQARARGEEAEEEKASGTSGRRKRDGVVYTPDYIARFIVERTIGAHLKDLFAAILATHTRKGADPEVYEAIVWRRKSAEGEAWRAYRDRLATLRVVDPACGSGVFLVMAFDYLKAEYARVNAKIADLSSDPRAAGDLFDPDSEILSNNLYGVDVNAESVEIAKLSLWIKTARRGKVLDSLSGHLRVGDSLIEDSNYAYLDHGFTWRDAFPDVMAEGGFDIVLGNPPYVRMEFLRTLKPYLEKRYAVVSDRADLYAYFFERGLTLLKPGGRMGYISSATFFKTGSGRPLRRYLLDEATMETVVDFGDLQVFEGVTTYPAILTMRRGAPPKEHAIEFWTLDALPGTEFAAGFEANAAPYPQAALTDGSWEFENPELRTLREKIRGGRPTLGEVYGAPCRGIVTGLNAAFVIDRATRDRLIAEDPGSADLLKPFLEGKDLKRWRAEPRDLWIVYIPKNRVDIDAYPAIRTHLEPFREKLESRATKQEWFELQQAQEAYLPYFEGEKILYGEFSSENLFSLNKDHFVNNKCYFVPATELWLLGYLNSQVFWFCVTAESVAVRGGFYQMHSQFVERASIPAATEAEKTALASLAREAQSAAEERYRRQEAVRRRIPDLCPPDRPPKLTTKLKEWWTLPDFSAFRAEAKKVFRQDIPLADRSDWEDWLAAERAEIARLSAEVAAKEAEIDARVHALFDLTSHEIALLEGSL